MPKKNNSPIRNLVIYFTKVLGRRLFVALVAFVILVLLLCFWINTAKLMGAEPLLNRGFDFGSPGIWTSAGILVLLLFVGAGLLLSKVLRMLRRAKGSKVGSNEDF